MFIGVPLVPYWSKLLNLRIGSKGRLLRTPGNAGEERGGSHLHADGRSLRSLPNAGKEMVRVHEVDPHQCKS